MIDHLTFDASPADEKCAQVGSPDYYEHATIECQVYRRQLLRLYKAEHNGEGLPEGCTLRIKSNSHDAGTYHEVGIRFDDNNPAAVNAAYWIDANIPSHWDEEAKRELEELLPSPNG